MTTNDNEIERVKNLTAISYSTCLHERDFAFPAILSKVDGAKIFSKLDLAQGYHQIVLDEKSRNITQIFSTHRGFFRYKSLIFGAKKSFEDFQKTVETNISHHIDSLFNISDDAIAHAATQNDDLQ